MRLLKFYFLLITIVISCKFHDKNKAQGLNNQSNEYDFTIAFGSCNNQVLKNNLWDDIEKNNPDVWIWGGDIIYSDTEDMAYMKKNYQTQKNNPDYKKFIENIPVLGTWDDHDYGLNDGGKEYIKKAEAQQLLLDFLDVSKNDIRRKREGVYYSKNFKTDKGIIKIIVLDTRYFRTALTPDTETKKRYKSNPYGQGTILGLEQWKWLENELNTSNATFNIIVSSIQFLSSEHGFETWGTMPHEVDKLEQILKTSKAKNTIILSGDRHISELSKKNVEGLNYPLIDFTSSGLTHSYSSFKSEPNKYRVDTVVSEKSFGILQFNFENNTVLMEMKGDNNNTYYNYKITY